MSMMPPKAAKTCGIFFFTTTHLWKWDKVKYISKSNELWNWMQWSNPQETRLDWLNNVCVPIFPHHTSRRDFLRVSTLILSLRLFTYLRGIPLSTAKALSCFEGVKQSEFLTKSGLLPRKGSPNKNQKNIPATMGRMQSNELETMVHYRRHQPATYPTPRLPWDIHAKRRSAIQEEPRTKPIFLNSRNFSTMIWSFDPQQNPWPSSEMPPYHVNTAQTVCQGQSSYLFSAMALHLYCETVKPNEPCLKDHKALRYSSTINANKTEEPELCQGGSGWKDVKFFPTHASIYSWSLPFNACF